MAKTIRFNLQFGRYEQPIRNINELMENFNIDLVLEAFQNGLLQRWLAAHNETELLEKIKEIPADIENDFKNIELLCKTLNPDLTRDEIESAAYPFEFRKKEEKRLLEYENSKLKKEKIIDDYYRGYTSLLEQMVVNFGYYQYLKTSTTEICDTYKYLFTLNIVDFYNYYVYDYPLVILSLLGNQTARKLLSNRIGFDKVYADISIEENRKNSFINRWKSKIPQPHLKICETKEDRDNIEDDIFFLGNSEQKVRGSSSETIPTFKLISPSKVTPPFDYIPMKYLIFPTYVDELQKTTQDYWEKIKPKGTKCLIIDFTDEKQINYINDNDKEREEGKLSASDVRGKFIIMDGLYYKSKNENARLIFMEL